MMLSEPLRIISDIHYGHPASVVSDPAELAPLSQDVAAVVFNGDTVEMGLREELPRARQHLKAIEAVCLSRGARAIFLNGNHDPVASGLNHLDLARSRVVVTHGDLLYHEIAPWSDEAAQIAAAHTAELNQLGKTALADFEERLAAVKRAAFAVGMRLPEVGTGLQARLLTVLAVLWPPLKPLQIFKVWHETPRKADAMAETFRPGARVVIIGHTHRCGVEKTGSRLIINTGSFMPLSGRSAVEISGRQVTIRRIVRRRGGFEPGSVLHRFDLPDGPGAPWPDESRASAVSSVSPGGNQSCSRT